MASTEPTLVPAKTRSAAIDLLRVLAIVAVTASHLWGDNPTVRAVTFSWHVPLFFFLSGYLWTSRVVDPRRDTRRELVARFRSLILPFLTWTVVFGVATVAYLAATSGVSLEGVTSTLWGGARARGPWSPYWFLPVLFFATVLYRWLEGRGVHTAGAVAIGAVALVACYFWGAQLALWTPQDAAVALPMLVFIGFGALVRKHEAKLRGRAALGLFFLLLSTVLLLTGWATPLDMKLGDFGTPGISVAVSLAMCVGLVWVTKGLLPGPIPGRLGILVSETAQTMVVVLLTHTFAYWLLSSQWDIARPVVFITTLVGTAALGLLLYRTPLSPWLVGVPRKTRAAA